MERKAPQICWWGPWGEDLKSRCLWRRITWMPWPMSWPAMPVMCPTGHHGTRGFRECRSPGPGCFVGCFLGCFKGLPHDILMIFFVIKKPLITPEYGYGWKPSISVYRCYLLQDGDIYMGFASLNPTISPLKSMYPMSPSHPQSNPQNIPIAPLLCPYLFRSISYPHK